MYCNAKHAEQVVRMTDFFLFFLLEMTDYEKNIIIVIFPLETYVM